MVDAMPGFLIMGTYLRIPWYNGTRRRRNAVSTQVFHHNQYETPRRERAQWDRPLALPSSVSTKDVYGMWITMWMSDQCHAVPQRLTHCPIDRQRNLCNFSKMQFTADISKMYSPSTNTRSFRGVIAEVVTSTE
jgi:hypothetical protein